MCSEVAQNGHDFPVQTTIATTMSEILSAPRFINPSITPPEIEYTGTYVPARNEDFVNSDLYAYLNEILDKSPWYDERGWGSLNSSVRSHDWIKPEWSDQGSTATGGYVDSFGMYCMACSHRGPWSNATEVWLTCGSDISNAIVGTVADDLQHSGGYNTSIRVPEPQSSPDQAGTLMACMAVLWLKKLNFGLGENPMVRSGLILTEHTPHGELSFDDPDYIPYNYSYSHPEGTPSRPWLSELPSAMPTETVSYPTIVYCNDGPRFNDCPSETGWKSLPIGTRVGIIIGVVAGILFFLFLCRWLTKRRRFASVLERDRQRERPRPMLLSEYMAQRARSEQARTDEHRSTRSLSRNDISAAEYGRAGATDGDADVPKPPPAYHEAVNEQERMLAQIAIRHNQAPAPSYVPPTSTRDAAPGSHGDMAPQYAPPTRYSPPPSGR